jgi:predicted N-formylglutamate amidohydrolase
VRFAALVLSCEHGGNRVPRGYLALFRSARARAALSSHRGYDRGALPVAEALARRLDAPLFACTTTRLLVEPNRSVAHPRLFSEFSCALDASSREAALREHHTPHRRAVEEAIAEALRRTGPVLHLSVHSFTPRLDGETRRADAGLLYDPSRPLERSLCARWQRTLSELAPDLRVRRNYPYRGTSDGLTTAMRARFGPRDYAGVELELNQAWVSTEAGQSEASALVVASLAALRVLPPSCRVEDRRRR